jgi:hypothetical protein
MKLLRLSEGFGAIAMEPDPAERIMDPDTSRTSAMPFYSGTSGTIPAQWSNAPILSGNRFTGSFGANPKMEKKIKIFSYQEFIETSDKFTNK